MDQSFSLTVELNDDDTNEETSEEDAIGLATYSNIDSTAFVYISIFENLWMRAVQCMVSVNVISAPRRCIGNSGTHIKPMTLILISRPPIKRGARL